MSRYCFKVITIRPIGGNKVPKGLKVTIFKDQPSMPSEKQFIEALKEQHGIELKGVGGFYPSAVEIIKG